MGLHLGLAGCGRWGRHILRDLRSLGCEVTVVGRSEATRKRAREGGARAVVPDVAELPGVDGVVVASPTATHASVVEALLPRGVPLFVEKPLTADRASAVRIAGRAGDRVFVMDKWRYHSAVERLGELARSGALGRVRGLRTTRFQVGNPHRDVDGVWILAPHDLAIGLEVLGAIPEPRHAVAERMRDPAGGLVTTGLTALLTGPPGGDGDEPWHELRVSTRHDRHVRELRVVGDDAQAWLGDAYGDHVAILRARDPREMKEPVVEPVPIALEMPLLRELRAFVDHLRGGPPPRSSAAEGLAQLDALIELRRLAGLSTGEAPTAP